MMCLPPNNYPTNLNEKATGLDCVKRKILTARPFPIFLDLVKDIRLQT